MTALDSASLDTLLHAATVASSIRPTVPLALATLVGVEGSSFRQPGARLLVDAESRCLAGAISGGCLEADVAARAADVCASGTALHLTYDLRDDLQTIWGFDAACDGIAHILLEPLRDTWWLTHSTELRRRRDGGCIVSVIDIAVDGGDGVVNAATMPAHGTAVVVDGDGHLRTNAGIPATSISAVGASAETPSTSIPAELERATASLAAIVSATGRASRTTFRIDNSTVTLFGDPITPPIALHVIGAGRGAEAFARIASAMGWQVTIVDHRPALLESLSVPDTVSLRYARPEQAAELTADNASAVALLTHIFDIDREWLTALLPMGHAYIGVLGSRKRAERLLDAVPAGGERRPVHAPIGLDIGGESPESIALATIGEIHAVMHGRPGGPLRERRSPIHDRTPTPAEHPTHAIITPSTCPSPE